MKKIIFTFGIILAVVLFANIHFDSKNSTINSSSRLYASVTNTGSNLWSDIDAASISVAGERRIIPQRFRTVRLNRASFDALLKTIPHENNVKVKNSNVIIELPLPDGRFGKFKVVESPVMAPELSQKFPEIRTFLGKGIDDGTATLRFDITPHGFHASVLSAYGDFFIDPYSTNDITNYISYYTSDFTKQSEFVCLTEEQDMINNSLINDNTDAFGEQLRVYRLALACTGEYATFHGGTVSSALAAMTTSVNRVNQVYERDFAIRLELIANNHLLVYTNAGTDPYTNNNGSAMLGQNQSNIDAVIGSPNYDIGHVFSTGGGGIAGLAVVCVNGQKARGVTGLFSPVGDPFDIDYVAHEMGHQYGGNHTQNNNCNRVPSAAFEPGSASTIMGYAGVCPPNLQNNSDDYFHVHSLIEMGGFISGFGGSCPTTTATGNTPPTVNMPTGGFSIPINTPFVLTGSATDPDGDTLTYCWEQYDLGPSGHPNSPSGNAPIFRSFDPVTSPSRTFPKLFNVINNSQTIGEILPSYARSLKFRLTVRDNNAGAGGHNYGLIQFNVEGTAGPFLVSSPNTAITWNAGNNETVTWDVANTNSVPVSCANVNILLSTDGGNTFPISLATNTPNDGSESITVPNELTTTARVKVEAADNIFFDMSNANFIIGPSVGITNLNTGVPLEFGLGQNYPNPFNPTTKINFDISEKSPVMLKSYDMKGALVSILINSEVFNAGYYSAEFNGARLPSGVYYYRLEAGSFTKTKKMILIK